MTLPSVLVTGCSAGGIGAALCREFQRHGLYVFATARSPSKIGDLAELPNVTILTLDVTSSTSIASAVEAVKKQTGGSLNYLVNNSGSQQVMPILDVDIDQAKKMYDVNVWGVVAVTQAFAPLIIAAKGTIINIGSIAGCLYLPWIGIYAGSKSAIATISEGLRLEVEPFGVKALTCITGAVNTKIFINAPEHRLPPGSIYAPAAKPISMRARGDVDDYSSPSDFASRLVTDVLNGTNGKTYRGKMATMAKYVSTYLPTFVLDILMAKGSGLDTLPGSSTKA